MWISDYITNGAVKRQISGGAQIISGGKNGVDASGSSLHSGAKLSAPYGYCAVPVKGADAVMLNASGEDYCLGVKFSADGLEPGEIRISSAGGASIELKNDGRVYINGKAVG